MIRRYEQSDGSVTRFWELERRDDVSFTCRWGRVGSAGRNERNYGHPDAAASKSAADKLIAEKVKTGFSPIGKPKKIDAPAKKRVVAKPAAAPDHAKLEAMLADNPDDAATWQVYADSLIQQDDAWGEVIAMAAAGKRPKTQQAEATKNLLKDLDGSTLEWRFGTIEKASLCPEEEDSGDSDGDDDTTPYAATLARILKHPAGRLVRELELGLPPNDDVDWSYDSILPALTGNGVLPLLRVLDMTADAEFMDQDSWRAIGDLSKLWAVIPQIREIRLKGSGNDDESTELGTVVAPHLEKFVHISSGLAKDVPIQLGKATLPELRHLELYLGGEDYGNTCKLKSFAGIFEGKGLPRLEYLGIVNSEWERDLIAALAKAPIVKRLKTLDLTKGTMWREAAQALLEYASAFRHLELLDVSDNYFDTQMCAAIKKAIPCANVADQKTLDDPDDDEPYRYVTVGE
jgi:predicted DNA-binding WGR domain protein